MRSTLILSGVAALSLTAFAAHAQQSVDPLNSVAPTVAPNAQPVPGDRARWEHRHRHGYDAKAKSRSDHGGVTPGFAQVTRQSSGNDAGNLIPYGPPR